MTSTNLLILNMRALIDHLRESGYKRLVCVGVSIGGSTCLRAAIEYVLDGLVVIGSMMSNRETHGTKMFNQPYGEQFNAEPLSSKCCVEIILPAFSI
jgi:esterase/lipase